MSHGLGITAALRNAPDIVIVIFAVITQLGDLWWFLLLFTLLYEFGDVLAGDRARERTAFVLAVGFGALAITYGLKSFVGHPRPPGADVARELAWLPGQLQPLWESISTGDGNTIPSGHATGATAVYGALAMAFDWGRRRVRYAVAGTLIALIALSRVIIGVHYVPDVIVGVGVGGGFLAVIWLLTGGTRVKRAFSVALLAAAVAAATAFTVETAALLGATLGGRISWTIVGGRLPTTTRRQGALAVVVALVGGGVIGGLAAKVHTPTATFLAGATGIAVVLAAPLVVARGANSK